MTTQQQTAMRLRLQATVTKRYEPDYAQLVVEDAGPPALPLIVLAQHCPPTLGIGDEAVLSGPLQLRAEHDTPTPPQIVFVLTVEHTEPATQSAPWAEFEGVVRARSHARTFFAPVLRNGARVGTKTVGFPAALPTNTGAIAPVQVIYDATSKEADDALSDVMMSLGKGDEVRVRGTLALMEREPDDEPGHDLQLYVQELARV